MKTKITKSLLLILLSALSYVEAQTIPCSSFCVTDLQIDTATSNLQVTIFFTGAGTLFINYPYVSAVKDNNGNTVATGTVNSFGQFGNTDYYYNTTTTLTSLPVNFNGTIYFNYTVYNTSTSQLDSMVCALPYPCITSARTGDPVLSEQIIYPNPSNGKIIIESPNAVNNGSAWVEVYDILGNKVHRVDMKNRKTVVDLSTLSAGVYFVKTFDGVTERVDKITIR